MTPAMPATESSQWSHSSSISDGPRAVDLMLAVGAHPAMPTAASESITHRPVPWARMAAVIAALAPVALQLFVNELLR